MRPVQLRWPGTTTVSVLAGLTSWIALWGWAGFVERPSGFLIPTLGAVIIVATSGALLRSARVPALLVVVGQLFILLVWFNHRWAEAASYWGWVPSSASLREVVLRVQVAAGSARDYAAPVPDDVLGIFPLLILAGTATAVLVDFLACGLHRVPAAGLPLLAVCTAPISILDGGVPWWAFAAASISFLFLLSSDESRRLSNWGRQISGSGRVFDTLDTSVSLHTLRASARKIGFTATGLAVVIPIFVPTLSEGLLGGSGDGSGGNGDSVAIHNPLVDLKRDLTRGRDVDLVEVRTTDPDPTHLRITVLDAFDGSTWEPSGRDIPPNQRADGRVPPPDGLSSGVPQTKIPYELRVSNSFATSWLPLPYPVSAVSAPGDWRYDTSTLDFISAAEDETAAGLDYSAQRLSVQAGAQSMVNAGATPEEIFTPYTELPDDIPILVANLARKVTATGQSKFEKAVQLQDWFRKDGGFTYSLERGGQGSGTDDLVAFLGDDNPLPMSDRVQPASRVGYCEQFAAAMAVMGRSLGIPSRVVVGFLEPERVGEDLYVYSAHDLHAWPEMYFEGVGWQRFEPTPGDRAPTVPAYTTAEFPAEQPTQGPSPVGPRPAPNAIERDKLDPGLTGAGGGDGTDQTLRQTLAGVVGGLIVLILLTGPRVTRALVRRRRWRRPGSPADAAEAAWAELRDSAVDLGVAWDETVTVRTRARALVKSFGRPGSGASRTGSRVGSPHTDPEDIAALERLVKHLERARYARSVEAAPELKHYVERCVTALRNGTTKQRRLRATWFPASLVAGLRAEIGRRSARTPVVSDPGVDHAV